MLLLKMTNDNDIASKVKVTIRILFIFGRIIVLIIRIRLNSKDPLFSTALLHGNIYTPKRQGALEHLRRGAATMTSTV